MQKTAEQILLEPLVLELFAEECAQADLSAEDLPDITSQAFGTAASIACGACLSSAGSCASSFSTASSFSSAS